MLDITKEQYMFFEKYLKDHPVQSTDMDLETFDDDRMNYNHQAGCSRLVKLLLDGKIKQKNTLQ